MQLPDTVTLDEVSALLPQVEAAAASAPAGGLQIDASALKGFDTSLLALLLEARRLAEARGLAFAIVAAPAKLAELADLYGVAGLLSLSVSTAPMPPARSVAM